MLISSVNSIALAGRSIISPALRHRTIQPQVKSLKEYSQDDLTKIVNHWLSSEEGSESNISVEKNIRDQVCENIAENFLQCLNSKGGKDLNLRMLRNGLSEILPSHIGVVNLLLATKKNPSSQVAPSETQALENGKNCCTIRLVIVSNLRSRLSFYCYGFFSYNFFKVGNHFLNCLFCERS